MVLTVYPTKGLPADGVAELDGAEELDETEDGSELEAEL